MAYSRRFYEQRHDRTVTSTRKILRIVQNYCGTLKCVVDVGCGVGTWLAVLMEEWGVTDVIGIDGNWVDQELLRIPRDRFLVADLAKPHTLRHLLRGRSFDLAISLEVAEHLPAEIARMFIEDLTTLSRFVLFSAAIPEQGGVRHLNEQWPDYWVNLFKECGFSVLDVVRPEIWQDREVALAYRQNTFLFVATDVLNAKCECLQIPIDRSSMLSVVHPELYLRRCGTPSVWRALKILVNALRRSVSEKYCRIRQR